MASLPPIFSPTNAMNGILHAQNPSLNTQSCIKGPFCCTFKFENSILAYFDLKSNFFFTSSGDAKIHSFHKQCLHNNSFYHNPLIAGLFLTYSKYLKSQDLRFVTYVWYFYNCSNINTVVKKLIIEFAYNHFNFGGIHLSIMQICKQKVKTSLPVWK